MNHEFGTAMATGSISIEEAAQYLSFGFPPGSNSMLLTKRLIARGFLPAFVAGNATRVSLDALKSFVSDGAAIRDLMAKFQAADDSLVRAFSPAIPISEDWFNIPADLNDSISRFVSAVNAEIVKQFPDALPTVIEGPSPVWERKAEVTQALRESSLRTYSE